jgi:serine protease inhibitor
MIHWHCVPVIARSLPAQAAARATEAAAAMSIQFIRGYVPADFAFIVDRPFYWDICDKESNLLLLVGFVANPTDR